MANLGKNVSKEFCFMSLTVDLRWSQLSCSNCGALLMYFIGIVKSSSIIDVIDVFLRDRNTPPSTRSRGGVKLWSREIREKVEASGSHACLLPITVCREHDAAWGAEPGGPCEPPVIRGQQNATLPLQMSRSPLLPSRERSHSCRRVISSTGQRHEVT